MIYRVFSNTVKPGKMKEARQHLLDLAAYVMENYGHKSEILSNISGPSNRLHLVGYHESLESMEKKSAEYATDSKLQELIARGQDFHEDDLEVSLYRVES